MAIEYRSRGAGKTTEQMLSAPQGAVFMASFGARLYMKHLAQRLGRADLEIVGPSFAESQSWRGTTRPVVVDHAVDVRGREIDALIEMQDYLRSLAL